MNVAGQTRRDDTSSSAFIRFEMSIVAQTANKRAKKNIFSFQVIYFLVWLCRRLMTAVCTIGGQSIRTTTELWLNTAEFSFCMIYSTATTR